MWCLSLSSWVIVWTLVRYCLNVASSLDGFFWFAGGLIGLVRHLRCLFVLLGWLESNRRDGFVGSSGRGPEQ